jgi:hypothetical protein
LPQLPEQLPNTIVYAAGAAALVVVLLILLAIVRRIGRGKPAAVAQADRPIDVAALSDVPRPSDGTQLAFYHVPVRVAAVVIAPAGRGRQTPPAEVVPELLDQMSPGLGEVVRRHQPEIRRWPEQLSTSGFIQRFFALAPLPGDAGKGTPWCAIAGRFDAGGGSFLAGLVCRSDKANNFSQVAVQRSTDWLDVLRVRT